MSLVHEALFYRDAPGYLSAATAFVRAGLVAGEPVLVAVPATSLDLLRPRLPDGVTFLDMSEVGRNPGRIIPGVLHRFVDEHEGLPVRVVGEPLWPGRTPDEYPGCVQHEAMINLVFGDRPARMLCPYDARRLDAAVLADAERTHPLLVDGAGRRASAVYGHQHTVVDDFNRPLADPAGPADVLLFDLRGLGRVRRWVAAAADRAGLDGDRADDLQVAVNEIATNAVTHSHGPGALRVWADVDRVVCEVSSPGELTDRFAGRIPPAFDSESGRGLVLVNHLCDLVQLHTGREGTTVRLHVLR